MFRKISASVDGGPSGGSRVHRPGNEAPIGASGNILYLTSDIILANLAHLETAGCNLSYFSFNLISF